MTIAAGNIFSASESITPHEQLTTLLDATNLRLERIVSHAHASPEGFWYDQERSEWVLLVQGEATLRFEGDEIVELRAGDHLLIPAGVRHRVERTSADAVWMALHFREG